MTHKTLKLDITIEKVKDIRGRIRQYKAALFSPCSLSRALEAEGKTESAAIEALQTKIQAHFTDHGQPYTLPSWTDPNETWIAYPNNDGYTVSWIRNGKLNGGSYWRPTRHAAIEALHAHWYQLNAGALVDGIIGLCTDRRRFECSKCRSVSISSAPYRCTNPGCGLPRQALPGSGELPANLERDLRNLLPEDWNDYTPNRGPQ